MPLKTNCYTTQPLHRSAHMHASIHSTVCGVNCNLPTSNVRIHIETFALLFPTLHHFLFLGILPSSFNFKAQRLAIVRTDRPASQKISLQTLKPPSGGLSRPHTKLGRYVRSCQLISLHDTVRVFAHAQLSHDFLYSSFFLQLMCQDRACNVSRFSAKAMAQKCTHKDALKIEVGDELLCKNLDDIGLFIWAIPYSLKILMDTKEPHVDAYCEGFPTFSHVSVPRQEHAMRWCATTSATTRTRTHVTSRCLADTLT